MSLHLPPDPRGIDVPIQRLATYLYEDRYTAWGTSGLTSQLFEMYGRCYRNETVDGFIPQAFVAGKDYELDMFYNDKLAVLMWFGIKDPTGVEYNRHAYNVELYVMCNADMLYPDSTGIQRVDERIENDVLQLLQYGRFGFIVKSIERDIDNVLSRFSGAKKKTALKTNMQPKLCFRVNMENAININDYNCAPLNPNPYTFNMQTGTIVAIFKENPDLSIRQRLVNGTYIPLQYPVGNTLTIPHLDGRYLQMGSIQLDGTTYSTVDGAANHMPYDAPTTTFTYGSDYPNDGYQPESILTLMYEENT